jgi:hypothetical protein
LSFRATRSPDSDVSATSVSIYDCEHPESAATGELVMYEGERLLKALIELTVFTHEHSIHSRLRVVINTPRAGALEVGKSLIVSIKHHLLSFMQTSMHRISISRLNHGPIFGNS